MPLSLENALELVDPSITDEDARKQSAQRIVDGVAANEVYWSHRSDLDALRAQAEGHGPDALAGAVQAARSESEGEAPASVSGTASAPAIDGTATEEPPTTALAPGGSVTANAEPAPVPSPDNPNDAIAKLRQQLSDAGIAPEA